MDRAVIELDGEVYGLSGLSKDVDYRYRLVSSVYGSAEGPSKTAS